MSNIHDYVPGEKPGRTITWVESQEEVVSAPAINPPLNWGGHPLVRTTNHGDLSHKTPERSASPVGGAAGAAAPEPDESGDDSVVTDKSGSVSPVRLGQPFTQDIVYSDDSVVVNSAPGSPQRNEGDTAEVLEGKSAKLRKIVDKQESTARLLAIENARIRNIIGNNHWSTDRINQMPVREGLPYRPQGELVEFARNALDELNAAAVREEKLIERNRELEAQIQAGPPLVSPAAGGAGCQPVSSAAGGVGYSPVSPAGGAGCQPVFLDGQNWMMPPFPWCKCTDRPKRPYVPRRIRKEGPNQGMVMGACANWEYKGYPGCGWYDKPFIWPAHLSPT
tara:strand:+ start:83 stop:1090 length:1008 start_codon:yes stop_codon:yes gene_type:complete